MEILNEEEIKRIIRERKTPCVSIFMPTFRRATQAGQNAIRFKNLIRRARHLVESEKWPPGGLASNFERASRLVDAREFWLHQDRGLALFISPTLSEAWRLPISCEEKLVVASEFSIRPILPLAQAESRFFLLAISRHHVRLLDANQFSATEIAVPDAPESIEETLQYDDPEKEFQFHTHASQGRRGTAGPGTMIFHGHAPDVADEKKNLFRFCREIDHGLRVVLANETAPLILAGIESTTAVYRQANTYPHLFDRSVDENPEYLTSEELRERGWRIFEPYLARSRRDAIARYDGARSVARASASLSKIAFAAIQGKVETLFIERGAERWGLFDEESGAVTESSVRGRAEVELLNAVARRVFETRGAVHELDRSEMPEGSSIAALYRF